MKWVVRIGVALFLVIVLVTLAGSLIPRTHRVAVRAAYVAPRDSVYRVIEDVARGAEWRTGLERVELLSAPGEPLRWREVADWGTLTFERPAADPPRMLVSRIVDEGQGFGGTWTWELTPAGPGTIVVITENGVIDRPIYRLVSKYLMGYHEGIETYARDLGRRLGEEVEPARIE
jgi:hypothetical protein